MCLCDMRSGSMSFFIETNIETQIEAHVSTRQWSGNKINLKKGPCHFNEMLMEIVCCFHTILLFFLPIQKSHYVWFYTVVSYSTPQIQSTATVVIQTVTLSWHILYESHFPNWKSTDFDLESNMLKKRPDIWNQNLYALI